MILDLGAVAVAVAVMRKIFAFRVRGFARPLTGHSCARRQVSQLHLCARSAQFISKVLGLPEFVRSVGVAEEAGRTEASVSG